VIEMLAGQLYLVTVIGLLIGNLGSRRKDDIRRARRQTMPAPNAQDARGNKSLPTGEKS